MARSLEKKKKNHPTRERVDHAIYAGLGVIESDVLTPSGQVTGHKRVQIRHPFEEFYKRDIITGEQYSAGLRFRELMVGTVWTPKVTADYTREVHGAGGQSEAEQEKHIRRQREYDRAYNAIPYSYRPLFMGWLIDAEGSDTGLLDLGRRFTDKKSPRDLSAAARKGLNTVLDCLAKHFGLI